MHGAVGLLFVDLPVRLLFRLVKKGNSLLYVVKFLLADFRALFSLDSQLRRQVVMRPLEVLGKGLLPLSQSLVAYAEVG